MQNLFDKGKIILYLIKDFCRIKENTLVTFVFSCVPKKSYPQFKVVFFEEIGRLFLLFLRLNCG